MRLILLGALSLAACWAPLAAAQGVPFEMAKLDNGLTVIVHEDHSAPVVSVNTWYHVGSAREKPGRTGFAHLFEHIMFEGSKNVPEGAFDRWLEAAGGDNNGSTTPDRTNYYEYVPSNALELPLFLESDRMGFLVDAMSPAKVDGQRDVVKNERRQSYENRPYGMADIALLEALYPAEHPYHWPTIGSMEDLTAAGFDDVVDFFRRFYGPANASVVIAGDVDAKEGIALARKWFADLPRSSAIPPVTAAPVILDAERRVVLEDKVQLPRLYLEWPTPAAFAPAEPAIEALAGVLASGKNSRLYKRLVYDLQVAQDVSAWQDSGALASTFTIAVTARAGHTLDEIAKLVDEEIAKTRAEAPSERELSRFVNRVEASFLASLETVGGKADRLNRYYYYTGIPDYFDEDLARYRALKPSDVQAAAVRFLGAGRVMLSVVPEGHREMAVSEAKR